MNYSVEEYKDFENKLRCDLTDMDTGLSACFWLTVHLRDEYPVFNTALTYAYQAKFYFEYFDRNGIDVVERVESGGFLTKQEYEDYVTHCLYKVEYSPNKPSRLASIEQYSHKSLDNLIHATRNSQSRVAAATTKLRVNAFTNFLTFLFEHIHAGNNVPIHVEDKYKDLKARFKRYTKRIKEDNGKVKDVFEQAIPTDVYFRMLELSKPHHPENPWSIQERLRNHLIVQIFNETGIRLGALCKLKISDLRNDKQTRVRITRSPDDPTDSRARPAVQKTKAHTSAVSHELMDRLMLYIHTERSKYPEALKHDFIFVAEKGLTKGQPIALQTVYYTFMKLSKKLGFHINPHLMRHKFQEIFEEAGEKKGHSVARINDLKKFACGWSETSEMVNHYNQFKIAMAASEISKQAQRDILSGMKELERHES